ncbi:MAG TPA: site-specific DNA-methyltransferase [Solirubrobacteraceae bacterium]|jgi:site-specific DNA-methyltransferase (adenine-specific)
MSTAKLALYEDDTRAWGLIEADALLTLAKLPDACVDSVICDPPYGIEITGEAWDGLAIRQAVRREGETLSTGEALERWTRVWAAEVKRVLKPGGHLLAFGAPRTFHRLVAGIEDAGLEVRDQLLWLNGHGLPKSRHLPGGQGTALKPCYEPVLLARAPFSGTVTANLKRWGTGALNIRATRIKSSQAPGEGYWPAHLTLSHAPTCTEGDCRPDCPMALLDQPPAWAPPSRLFYCAKASKAEREAGCERLPARLTRLYNGSSNPPHLRHNVHPCVKPLELMRWLVRLITPPGGLVLDPFTGSGSTGAAAVLEGRQFLGIEREGRYVDIACGRLTHWAHEARKSS